MKAAGPYASEAAKASDETPARDLPRGTVLPHLGSPAARMRQVLAASAITSCRHIVEIGGAGLPITDFLTHRPDSVTVVDPKIPAFSSETLNGAPCQVRHLRAKLQQVALDPIAPYALVLLGLSLRPFGQTGAISPALLTLAAGARVLVIDYALDLPRANAQIDTLLATRTSAPRTDLVMTLDDDALRGAAFARRRFIVFDTG